jgi:hypothetical protein
VSERDDDNGFLSRWSRRKALARDGLPVAPATTAAAPAPNTASESVAPGAAPGRAGAPDDDVTAPAAQADADPVAPPAPTLDDVAQLTPASDFSRFVAPGVDGQVRNAALKRLFADPRFNVMDGLDTYIDDYGKPDPLPAGMLRKMAQSEFLNLFADGQPAHGEAAAGAAATDRDPPPDENPDLRLQPHDAAGPPGAEPGPGEDAGGQH